MTTQERPANATHWSTRSLGRKLKLSQSTVSRVWRTFGLQPHRTETFKLSTDPFFVEKVRDIVGLYLDPPTNALVLCVDEKSQCQALERSQPALPMGLGYLEGYTHDYLRHGTTTLFAAFDIATGKVMSQCKKRHRHQEFIRFLLRIDEQTPRDLDLHLIVDNYGTHKHPKVKEWLAAHPRLQLHFTPTSASWLNLVERWFGLITGQVIRRGSFDSVRTLERAIRRYLEAWNQDAQPFTWTKSARQIRKSIDDVAATYETSH